MLSDSLELLHFLHRHGQDQNLVEPAIEKLDDFTDKWRDGTFRLLQKASIDEEKLKNALHSALDEMPDYLQFVSNKQLSNEPLKEQSRFYRIAYDGSLTRALKRCKRHEKMYAAIRNYKEDSCDPEVPPRSLRQLIRLSLGTRTLQPALDSTFGNSVSNIVKKDITELWYCRFGYVLLGEFAEAERLDPLIESCRRTPVLGRHQKSPFTWLFWED